MTYDPNAGISRVSEQDTRPQIKSPELAFEVLRPCFMKGAKSKVVEELWLLSLDPGSRLCGKPLMITRGDCDGTDVPVKAVFRAVLSRPSATGFIMAHNHPTGSVDPSPADVAVTRKVIAGCRFLDLNLADHLIISGETWTSLRRTRVEVWGG